MKQFLKRTYNSLLKCIYYITTNNLIRILINEYKKIKTSTYNQWISFKFGTEIIGFRYPINYLKGCQYFKINKNTSFGKLVILTAWDHYNGIRYNPKVIIGDNCKFGDFLHLTSINSIQIGNHVLTGRWVTISDNGHGNTDYESFQIPPLERNLISKGPIIIEDNVWIGDKATILSGVKIGKGAVIAANTVVTKDVPAYSVVGGNPVRIIKQIKKNNE